MCGFSGPRNSQLNTTVTRATPRRFRPPAIWLQGVVHDHTADPDATAAGLKEERLNSVIFDSAAESSLIKDVRVHKLVTPRLEGHFLWLPWNWATHKRILRGLSPSPVRSLTTVLEAERFVVASGKPADGSSLEFNRRLCGPLARTGVLCLLSSWSPPVLCFRALR